VQVAKYRDVSPSQESQAQTNANNQVREALGRNIPALRTGDRPLAPLSVVANVETRFGMSTAQLLAVLEYLEPHLEDNETGLKVAQPGAMPRFLLTESLDLGRAVPVELRASTRLCSKACIQAVGLSGFPVDKYRKQLETMMEDA
jgi:hypothetical protein